ncbi:3-oxoacyl-reductase [Lophiostoma macrostomum CBS 122681]|uniref:3-oxoacyl-reductase n=1 Tax=Lophiostoma macrostomum CBS 122681 TaxID=1314788 RepID=A0A6A6T991_9PLEO|nr:3-oxoacyl-reductase [Lophiostoma macrostomum CBS 122681]
MSQFRSLNILITGGARGIGRGLFRQFLSTGHRVFILDNNTIELDHTDSKASTWGVSSDFGSKRWHVANCDLSDRAAVKRTVSEARDFFDGKLDVLINNAFSFAPTPSSSIKKSNVNETEDETEDAEMADWDTKLAVGLTAPYLLSRLCLPMLQAGHTGTLAGFSPGCIINVSSTRAYQSEPHHEAYSAVKARLLGLTQSMAVTLGHSHKVRVNAIVPGWIHIAGECKEADEAGTKWEEGLSEADMEWHPAGRVGKVEDVVRAVEYLVDAEFVTGQEVVVDGGVGRKMVYPE